MNTLTNSLRTLAIRSAVPSSSNPSLRYFSCSPSSSSSALDNVIKQAAQSSPKNRRGGGGNNNNKPRNSFYQSDLLSSSSPSFRTSNSFSPSTPEEIWSHSAPIPYSPSVTTTSARSFAVQSGNVARAYRNLNRVLNENQVRRELKRQERFESPSNKRVRLNSERHRRRFKVAVGKAVSLAMRMKDL
ncbi:mitochondrial 37S ribosomal protein bS21m MRP21 [Sporobolomyces salmoneus]|uniref:mitochondrial 37S ribosomal protein bS21m MRP21 n=1 Tax=Sporobolomyces salmoneus TaxID=183962 RepID=UPI00317B8DA6